ncbi:methylmalonyl-CoA epimerase [Fibrella aquatilis]|uniref:Methylmalonyl-CoA epimerase n=1 Tax=Fibrella aquatilis TaxID=2817059 RepID=A0A939G6H5_9BACT|nr:methylmalonyl-CoA epimerase [Fibrella aquatilis]MBO0931275.1 methylmalonyl-CoA epimerase [Fibrella aquatilis]
MFTNVEHIGIAVRDLTASTQLFATILNRDAYKSEEVASEGVLTTFFQVNQTKIELLAATRPDSAIATFIDKRGEGTHHIAFEVDDIVAEMARLKAAGFTLLNEIPKQGADNKLVCFVHPKTANGVLIELCQDRGAASGKV